MPPLHRFECSQKTISGGSCPWTPLVSEVFSLDNSHAWSSSRFCPSWTGLAVQRSAGTLSVLQVVLSDVAVTIALSDTTATSESWIRVQSFCIQWRSNVAKIGKFYARLCKLHFPGLLFDVTIFTCDAGLCYNVSVWVDFTLNSKVEIVVLVIVRRFHPAIASALYAFFWAWCLWKSRQNSWNSWLWLNFCRKKHNRGREGSTAE